MLRFYIIIVTCALVPSVIRCCTSSQPDSVRLEIPSHEDNACILEYKGYAIEYDESSRIPVWVAYELTRDEADGTIGRGGKSFRQDENARVLQADYYDYRGSGWSRGHMAPAGDFKWDEQAMRETFYYTNCCPQDEKLNNGSWNVLENKVRSWARQFGQVWVVTGPIIGENSAGTIGAHKVVVPDSFYKAVVTYINGRYHGIAFVMANVPESQRLYDCVLSINKLESISGLDFYSSLDDEAEEGMEDSVDFSLWGIHLN